MDDRTLRVLEYNKIINMLSLYTYSELGKEVAIALKPSTNTYEIQEWLNETSEGVDILLKNGKVPFDGIYDIRTSLKRAEIGSIIENNELIKISSTLSGSRKFKAFIKESKRENFYPIIEDLASLLTDLKSIEESINNVVISDDEISDKASPELFSIRKKIKDTNGRIRDKLNNIITSVSYQKYLQEQIVTIRNDRFVVPVKQEFRGNIPGVVHDQSLSGATLYIEPMAVVDMNNELKQLKLKEKDEIDRILLSLSYMISEKSQEIQTNLEILTTLDFIFAKARFSLDYNCTVPIINKSRIINLTKARHPLIEAEKVIPIDISIGDDFKILIITGPNTGGKTVSLKTVGLLSLMAQSGLHIPAGDKSELCVFDEVFADIGDEQSIEQSLSTFSSHMKNIVNILDNITENSLVLLDELGAGTDPTEGAALAMSILELLRSKQIIAIATTHYSELKAYALSTKGLRNGSVEFDVQTLKPTYKLSIGIPGKSNAFEISKKLGLGENIINRAKDFITEDKVKFEDVITGLEEDRKKSSEARDITERLRVEAEAMKQDAETRLLKISEQRDKIIREAYEEAKKIVDNSKTHMNDLMKELKEAADKEAEEKLIATEKARLDMKALEDNMEEESKQGLFNKPFGHKPPKKLRLGDTVKIISLEQTGNVITMPDENGNLNIQVGIMKVNVNIKDIALVQNVYSASEKIKHSGIGKAKADTVSLEIDLRGKTLDEALLDVDKYLDDVYLSKKSIVTIIHGKGTGVLRSGIIQLLRTHPHVKSFRSGGYHEGGLGVTIVEIKQ